MKEDKHNDADDRIEIEVDTPTPIPKGTRFEDAVEKDEDFSGDLEPAEEEAHLAEEPTPQSRVTELEDKLLRTAAEFDNYKKRTARQFDEVVRTANDRLFSEVLEVVDNFERARSHMETDTDPKALREGMDLIYNQLQTLLARNEITPIEAVGKVFDPHLHDAMMQVDSNEYPEGTVAMELSRGYQQGNRVLRHSKVGVSRGKSK